MKLFTCSQIKQIDAYTIENEPVSSVDLMERAAGAALKWYLNTFDGSKRVIVFTGPGNNGGDGLAMARMLFSCRIKTEVWHVGFTDKTTSDWKHNFQRLTEETAVSINILSTKNQLPVIDGKDIVIDAIFGSGLSRPAEGLALDVIRYINSSEATVVSIDIPSGMFGEDNTRNDNTGIVSADYTLSFQFPKLAFMFPENAFYTGEWVILPIGLSRNAIANTSSPFIFLDRYDIAPLIKKRRKFDHKGIYGHGLLCSGSYGKIGAAILGARAALKTGIGLISCHIPSCGLPVMQCAVPEAMAEPDRADKYISDIIVNENISAVAIGPGIGTDADTKKALQKLMTDCKKPMVIDADALNIISAEKDLFRLIPEGSVLTPHPKEFERLTGKSGNSYLRLNKQLNLSSEYKCYIVLKGANTSVTTPEGRVYFNSTGNPGMATAGSGDVLTGIILSLLSQGYNPEQASTAGVFLHGMAGDIAANKLGMDSLTASDIINNISDAFLELEKDVSFK